MKNVLVFIALGIATRGISQTPFKTIDSINANNISAATLVHGDMWWNPVTGKAQCNFPNGTAKNIGFAASLWLSGYDDAGQLHVAAQTYRQDGNDYWPGPLDGSGNLDYATSEKWAKIWKVTRAQVNESRATSFHTLANIPEPILTWPGKNSEFAKGKDGAPLTITTDMAPFVDMDGDGKYEPLKGDYPDFRGEQCLWWVFSDNGPTHTQSKGNPLKVEVHAMAYAYKRGTLIDNVVYYDFTLVNRSSDNYHSLRTALWDDAELGYAFDDYVAFDSARRLTIMYNANASDGAAGGNPANSYGKYPPARGVTLISLPGDLGTGYVPAGSFTYYNNDATIIGNPVVDTQINHYMRSRIRNGTHLQYMGQDRNYIFAGDPSEPGSWAWSECAYNTNPGDRRFVLASNDFTLNVGSRQRILMALVVSDSAGGCPNVDLSGLKEVADTAWHVYHNPPPAIFVPNVSSAENSIRIYPNPAHDKLYVETGGIEMIVRIYNVLGQQMGASLLSSNEAVIDVNAYPPGAYFLFYSGEKQYGASMFMKE